MFKPEAFLDLAQFPHPEIFADMENAWEVLAKISGFLRAVKHKREGMRIIGTPFIADDVTIGPGTVIEHGAVIHGPAAIGKDCHLRPGAYIRGNVITGDGCVLGNGCEFKNALLFNGVDVAHFSYVGDSVLGHDVHLGAGSILSNKRSLPGTIRVRHDTGVIDTGLAKFGAVLGDRVEIGCNCVLSPGSIIGRDTVLYPNLLWRGVCPEGRIVKLIQDQRVIERRM